ncbi:type-1 angiotensin II receptor-associated protein [Arapaima gigas]
MTLKDNREGPIRTLRRAADTLVVSLAGGGVTWSGGGCAVTWLLFAESSAESGVGARAEGGLRGELGILRSSSAMEIPAINLKAIVFVHWLLTIWGCMFTWLPASYAWGNFSVLALAVWAIAQRDSVDAMLMFLIGMLVTMLTDIIHFGIFYPLVGDLTGTNRDTFRFSVGMAILSLLLKPISCFFVYQMYRERGGDYNVNFGFPSVTRNRDAYQSIDQQDHSGNSATPFNQSEDCKSGPRSY